MYHCFKITEEKDGKCFGIMVYANDEDTSLETCTIIGEIYKLLQNPSYTIYAGTTESKAKAEYYTEHFNNCQREQGTLLYI